MKKRKNSGMKIFVISVTAFIVLLMVISIFAVVLDNQSSSVPKYGKHSFSTTNNGYKTKINGNYQEFYYHPLDVEYINLTPEIISMIRYSKGIGFVFNPEDNITDNLLFIDVIRYELELQFSNPTYFGIDRNSTKYSLPVIGCSDATSDIPIIIINTSLDTGFYATDNPNCIIMNGRLRTLLALKDRMVYSYYGVMDGGMDE